MRAIARDEGIRIDILGDSGPFSKYAHSIGYRIRHKGESRYLLDCGAPLFKILGEEQIAEISGLIGTHSHEDHRRWFTDLALFMYYRAGRRRKLRFITSELIHEEYKKNSRAALERSLSHDSRLVIEIPYEDFVEPVTIGPLSKFVIRSYQVSHGTFAWRVVDRQGDVVSPHLAKVVVQDVERANRPRMIFRDPGTGDWVEPELYFSLSDPTFYEEDQNVYTDSNTGLSVRAIKDPVWHGPPAIGVEFTADDIRVVFSSDTVYDPDLWLGLCTERRPQKLDIPEAEFDQAYLIYGNVNNYVERTWSRRRYEEALKTYDSGLVIHDVAEKNSVVHTDYRKIVGAGISRLILTHSPDQFTSELPLAISEKTFVTYQDEVYEEVGDELFPLDADIYHKAEGNSYVGYRSERGKHRVVERDGMPNVIGRAEPSPYKTLFFVDLYQDIAGKYFPALDRKNEFYLVRPDNKIERTLYTRDGSKGELVSDCRRELSERMRARKVAIQP